MNIFIYAYSYDENSGGSIALHRLCHLINEVTNYRAYLVPHRKFGLRQDIKKIFKNTKIDVHPDWNTPVWQKIFFPKKSVVIYPEIVDDNPLKMKHVVRWLLHQPGFHTGRIHYGEDELYFKFNSAIKDFSYENSQTSLNELKVIFYPVDIYKNFELERTIESCYMIRKGVSKPIIHDENSICLDGKSHSEIAKIFNQARTFICYDDYTAYSIFAVLTGCVSVVVPDHGVSIDEWYSNETDRYGIAYGVSQVQLDWANQTKGKVFEHIEHEHFKSETCVQTCMNEIHTFFKL